MKKLLNSNGFSALEVALVIIVMGLIGGTGYYVYNAQKESEKLLTDTNTSAPEVSRNQNNEAGYFEIKEWGIKFKVSDKLSDLYYVYNDDRDPATMATSVDFSLTTLKNTDCAVDKTSQFRMVRYSQAEIDELGNSTSVMAKATREESKKLGDYYYLEQSQSEVCSHDSSVQSKADTLRNELMEAIPSTLQLK